ncbi:MAG: hypothetical protein HPY68_02655 [Candidatus Atribacteria bacterium]|nr:hypothetical protein [Candidatus Atribacteria bacterium]
MKYWITFGCAFVLSLGMCRTLLFRKKFPPGSILWGLFLMLLPLLLPYRLIEKILLECGGGTGWVFLSNYSTNLVELLTLFIVLFLLKNQDAELFAHRQDVFHLSFFFGLHFGWGKALRDSLLAFFHHFSTYYGYSQFMIFPSFFYLALKIMEVIFEAQVGALLGIALFFPRVPSLQLPLLLFLLVFKGIPGFMETAIQFIPRFRFFSSLYPISLLPLTIILGFVVMQRLLQRKEEEKP